MTDLSKIFSLLDSHFLDYLASHGITPNQSGFINCLNPSHPDHNPSMHIVSSGAHNQTAGYCFSCGVHYSILHAAHILDNKALSGPEFFSDTIDFLCKKFGIDYDPIELTDDQKREYQRRRAYSDAVDVVSYGAWNMGSLNYNHPGIKHLLERGITEDSIKKFKIGFIDSIDDYLKDLREKGWEDQDYINSIDLANKKLFSNTGIIIPIFDNRNRPVGFVTRRTDIKMGEKGEEKFVNSVNSDIYHKSEILFNFNNYEKGSGPLFIVEGYLDAVYLTQMGMSNVVALGATILTEAHVDLIFREEIKDIVLCLDGDEGGIKGIKLAIERLNPYKKFKVRIVELPDKYDPDTYVKELGLNKLKDLMKIDNCLSPFAWTIKHTTFEDDPMKVAADAIPTIATEPSGINRMRMIKELARLTAVPEVEIRKDVDSLVNKESSAYLEAIEDVNTWLQSQLSRKKIIDTKIIIHDAMLRIKELEKKHNHNIDNRTEYENRLKTVKEKIDSGIYKYGLLTPKFSKFGNKLDGIPWTGYLTIIGGRPSSGKCHTFNTPILMHDGSIKLVQDIKVGDKIMGPDSNVRNVLSLGRGKDNLFQIEPCTGNSYGVNSEHILVLKRSRNSQKKNPITHHGDIIEITVKDYINKSKKFKNNFKGFKVAVDFPKKLLSIDPYFLGIWLGDGDSRRTIITNKDKEIINYLKSYAKDFDANIINTEKRLNFCSRWKFSNNKLHTEMKDLNILSPESKWKKYIPKDYLVNCKEYRLRLLAGLIDSDGSLSKNNSYYEITQKSEDLIDQIKFLADSLGFKTNKSTKKAEIKSIGFKSIVYRLLIKGDLSQIPCLVKRKICKNKPVRDPSIVGIKNIKSLGHGDYYGFTIDGDHRYLLGDCTVTHNTAFITALELDLIDSNEDCVIIDMSIDDTLELRTHKIMAVLSGLSTSQIKSYTTQSDENKKKIDQAHYWLEKNSNRYIIADATIGNTIDTLEMHVDWVKKTYPNMKVLAVLDNFHKLRTGGTNSKKSEVISDQSQRIKDIVQLYDIHLMMTVELRKLETSNAKPTLNDLKDSVQIEYDTDIALLVHNEYQVRETNTNVCHTKIVDGEPRLMPYVEISLAKNKVTGQIGKFAYKMNSHNMQFEEVPWAEVFALYNIKSNETIGRVRNY